MFDRDDLRAAVAKGVISADQAGRLEAFMMARKDGDPVQDSATGQENIRFLANFNDIFITLGLGILFTGLIAFVGMFSAGAISQGPIAALIFAAPIAGAAWLLMEYFCARRRLLLPSMFLSLVFVTFFAVGATGFYAGLQGLSTDIDYTEVFSTAGALGIVSFGSAFAASLIIFSRFRLPFSLALAALAGAGAIYVAFGFFGSLSAILGGTTSLLLGLGTLAVAIWFDMKDPERIRKASDNAFWLHLAAAPQIIVGVSTMVTGSNLLAGSTSGTDNATQSITLLIVLLLIGLVSLALNRRALIAASLLTFTFALGFVLNQTGMGGMSIFMMVTIIIGGGVVLLGAGWKTARRAALSVFPDGGVWDRLFPPEPV